MTTKRRSLNELDQEADNAEEALGVSDEQTAAWRKKKKPRRPTEEQRELARKQVAVEQAAVADWEHWKRFKTFTAKEISILRHARDPRDFEKEVHIDMGGASLRELVSLDLALIAADPKVNKFDRYPLRDWLGWFSEQDMQVPDFLRKAVETRDERVLRRIDEEQSKGNPKFQKTVAEEENVTVGRIKQIRGRAAKKNLIPLSKGR